MLHLYAWALVGVLAALPHVSVTLLFDEEIDRCEETERDSR